MKKTFHFGSRLNQYIVRSVKHKRQQSQMASEHFHNVANLAQAFASEFRSDYLAYHLGILHDIGKLSDEFQAYIKNKGPRTPHAYVATALLHKYLKENGDPKKGRQILEYMEVVNSHHVGLKNADHLFGAFGAGPAPVDPARDTAIERALKEVEIKMALDEIQEKIENPQLDLEKLRENFALTFQSRMLLSCLVDADYLDAESFSSPHITQKRLEDRVSMHDLYNTFSTKYFNRYLKTPAMDTINVARREIFIKALEAAELEPGIFEFAGPTGSGKTEASLGFGLRHSELKGKDRLIYVAPFLSIIDQTHHKYIDYLGEDNVLAHHSNVVVPTNTDDKDVKELAVDNWDMPIVVTTAVQFFESLFSCHNGKIRKLHNIANSVIILDETQSLPFDLLSPIVKALEELVRNYGCSIVLLTATQPRLFEKAPGFKAIDPALKRVVIPNAQDYFDKLNRVDYEYMGAPLSVSELIDELGKQKQALMIVNTKRIALRLVREAKKRRIKGLYHLSTYHYGAYRLRMIREIRDRLAKGLPVRVISTQLIEAGVDLDFPVVYRMLAPYDSIIQAGGRCNRNMLLPSKGKVYIFNLATDEFTERQQYPDFSYDKQTKITHRIILNVYKKGLPLALEQETLMDEYYRRVKKSGAFKGGDFYDILGEVERWNLQNVSEKFRMIQDREEYSIVVNETARIRKVEAGKLKPLTFCREVALKTVNVPKKIRDELFTTGIIRPIQNVEDYFVFQGRYSKLYGIAEGVSD